MRRTSLVVIYIASLAALLVAFFVYEQTMGQLTDYEQLAPELLAPMADETDIEPDPAQLRESEVAAIRGFGPLCPELNAPISMEWRPKNGAQQPPSHRGVGVHVFAHDYEVLKENPRLVRLHPCSIVHVQASPSGKPEQDEINTVRGQEAFVEFDRPIDKLTDVSGAQAVGGWINGKVELKNNRRTDDAHDDVVVFTERLDFREDKNKIWTDGAIKVIESDSQITGVGVEIELTEVRKPGEKPRAEARRLRIYRDVSFFLFVSGEENFLGAPAPPVGGPAPAAPKSTAPTPIRVTSRGPFTYDLEARQASFIESVRVLRQAPAPKPGDNGPVDQLECDKLVLDFESKSAEELAKESKPVDPKNPRIVGPAGDMRLKSATATGAQVLLLSESERLQATGTYLLFETRTRRSILRGEREAVALHDNAVIRARSLIIEQGDNNTVRNFVADGPNGSLETQRDEKSKDRGSLRIRWQGQLTMAGKPGVDSQLVTINGGVELDADRLALKSERLKVWLVGIGDTSAGRNRRVEPVKIEASGAVSAKGDNLAVVSESLLVDIVYLKSPLAAPGKTAPTPVAKAEEKPAPALKNAQVRSEPKKPEEDQLDVRAKRVALVVERQGEVARPIKAWAEGDVVVTQPTTHQTTPLEIRGHTLDFNRAPEGDIVTVGGAEHRFAFIKSSEMTIAGKNHVRLNEPKNRLDVAGPGYLIRPSQNDLTGKPTEKPQDLRVDWEKSMAFDGKFANFEGGVKAQQGTAEIYCHTMEVAFDQRISFHELREGRGRDKRKLAKIDSVDCDKDVIVYDSLKKGDAFVRNTTLRVPELHFDNNNHSTEAKGPGTILIMERNDAGAPAIVGVDAKQPASPEYPFTLTRISFQGVLQAKQDTRNIKLFENIRIVRSPAERPDAPLDEDRLKGDGMVVEALKHAIVGVVTGEDGKEYRDFQAEGNVRVQARDFWGLGDKLSYDQKKDLLVFTGSSDQKAKLYRQARPGEAATEYPARTIMFWRGQNRIVTDSAESFDATIPARSAARPKTSGERR